jgi:L-ornithine N5-oxygenase
VTETANSLEILPADATILDFVGVGFGAANLALAVAAKEADPRKKGVFIERRSCFDWHPGLLFESSRMQISFLKDLATLRNPSSSFSFLQYLKDQGRLEHFVNLGEWSPKRIEYRDYLRWAAASFVDQVRYNSVVSAITPAQMKGGSECGYFRVDVVGAWDEKPSTYWTRNLVYAAGGKPRFPGSADSTTSDLIHSSDFLKEFPQRFEDRERRWRFAVVGNGQSAGEIVLHLLQTYPNARVDLIVSGYALRPMDSSEFVNEAFLESRMSDFFASSDERRARIRRELRNTNYAVVDAETIAQIYQADYSDAVSGRKRLYTHRFSRLLSSNRSGDVVNLEIADIDDGTTTYVGVDGVVAATGFDRRLDPEMFSTVLPLIKKDSDGNIKISKNFKVEMDDAVGAGLYAQGYGEASHGPGDTTLSFLPFKSREIFEQICRCADVSGSRPPADGKLPLAPMQGVAYPPPLHVEADPEKLYALLRECPFATLVSADGGVPTITHLPLILDRSKGGKGVLFGHVYRANPHLRILTGRRSLAVFHGPNSYITPYVWVADQLPTWNSMAVHVWGSVRLIETRAELIRGLASISEFDTRPGAYRLDPDSPRIERIIDYIVGFEFEIEEMVGRFKLSADLDDADQRRAAIEMAENTERGQRGLIESALGYVLEPESAPMPSGATPMGRHPQTPILARTQGLKTNQLSD